MLSLLKTSFVVVALLVTFPALGLAAPDGDSWLAADAAGDDAFTTLNRLFEDPRAVAPSRAEVTGWWTGRCFFHGDPAKAVASLQVAAEYPKSPDPGPIFPVEKAFKIVSLTAATRAPEYYDEMSLAGEARAKGEVSAGLGYVTTVADLDRSLQYDYISDTGLGVRYRVRRVTAADQRTYFVTKGTILRGHATLGEGETQSLCYHFAKARVNPQLVEPGEAPATKPEPEVTPMPKPKEPWCSCFCAGPVRPIRVRAPWGGYTYEYRHVPLFGEDGFTEYHVSGYDYSSCLANNGGYCTGYESYPRTGYASGFFYGCRLAP